jgi:uncharacterized 2Fe-2S/4Fe-4S cluster protein (DUF4445 family)
MAEIDVALKDAMGIAGALGAALVDFDSGMMLGCAGGGPNLDMEVAAAGNTDVVRAEMTVMRELGLEDHIEDILITLQSQYHLIRLVRSDRGDGLFFYVVLNKSHANLAMARRQLTDIEKRLEL